LMKLKTKIYGRDKVFLRKMEQQVIRERKKIMNRMDNQKLHKTFLKHTQKKFHTELVDTFIVTGMGAFH